MKNAPNRIVRDLFGGGKAESVLPERIRAEIEQEQDRSELLIGWFQLGIVLTFGVLYLLSPKPITTFALEPWALSIYLALTVVRLVWASRARLPNWSLVLSIVFDMTLLMVLIWSFHIKYDQPASFYLKAPTMLYVFIFIALRALRFDWRWVALAGFVAVLGWGVLMVYVTHVDPDDNMITKDYVKYLTSNTVLLGAEFDKIVSILVVTGILTVALLRANRLLVRSVTEHTAAEDLSRFFAPEVAARIKGADQAIHAGIGEMREAAILNLDMRGFTKLAGKYPPAQVMDLLAEYQARMVPVIQKHGGSIDKFLGDGIMATFGVSIASPTHAADALRACKAALDEAQAWQRECTADQRMCPDVNGAVATGRVLFGAVGDESRLEYTVIGDAVNLSAKLEKHNKDLGVRGICDAATYDLACRQGFDASEAGAERVTATVAGVAEPLELVILVR